MFVCMCVCVWMRRSVVSSDCTTCPGMVRCHHTARKQVMTRQTRLKSYARRGGFILFYFILYYCICVLRTYFLYLYLYLIYSYIKEGKQMHPPPRQLKRACKIRLEAQTSSNEPSPENHYGLESSRVRLWIYPPIP